MSRLTLPATLVLCLLASTLCGGCVKRTIMITSEPSGALVWLNDREIGRTPVDVEFIHYGDYDVRLTLEGHQALLTHADANSPFWDKPGPDFVAEILPIPLESNIEWRFVLEPIETDAEAARITLVERARDVRAKLAPPAEEDPETGAH
jgi:hypothetical protein